MNYAIDPSRPASLLIEFEEGVRWHSKAVRLGEMRVEFNKTTVELELLDMEVTKTKEDANDCATKDYCSQDCKFFEDCFPEPDPGRAAPAPAAEPERGDDLDGDPDDDFERDFDCCDFGTCY